LDDPNLASLHKDTIIHLTGEVGDAFNRAIVLSDRLGKFDANPFAWRKGSRTAKANHSAAKGYIDNSTDRNVGGG
jgi:hypothetical protein